MEEAVDLSSDRLLMMTLTLQYVRVVVVLRNGVPNTTVLALEVTGAPTCVYVNVTTCLCISHFKFQISSPISIKTLFNIMM